MVVDSSWIGYVSGSAQLPWRETTLRCSCVVLLDFVQHLGVGLDLLPRCCLEVLGPLRYGDNTRLNGGIEVATLGAIGVLFLQCPFLRATKGYCRTFTSETEDCAAGQSTMVQERDMIVYIVHHERAVDADSWDTKLIGVFSTEDAAKAACNQLRSKPGFNQYPEGFSIDPYAIDKIHWEDGFVTSTGFSASNS